METSHKTSAELLAAQALAKQVQKELTEDILPYWIKGMCSPDGGFYGRIDGHENLDQTAPVGNIMTARVLWTFASAYRILKDSIAWKSFIAYSRASSSPVARLSSASP